MRWVFLLMLPCSAQAESLIATRLIAPGDMIAAHDVTLAAAEIPGALTTADSAVGKTARIAIYPGRPLLAASVGAPILIKRNQTVTLRYAAGALAILAEGRALGTGAAGDTVRVMNTGSKTTLTGTILPDGTIDIGGAPCVGC